MNNFEAGNEINPGHYFEFLDRTHLASEYLRLALGAHPVLAEHPEFEALYKAALDRLQELYQAVGQREVTWK